jgi:hypothetical protein
MVLAGVVMSQYSASVGTRLYSAAAPGLDEYSADMMESESVPAESNSAGPSWSRSRYTGVVGLGKTESELESALA